MAMNASAQSLIALMTSANLRFVIPVYQRPYSWDEDQCNQLWDDVLSVSRRTDARHFTGSIVWVQEGTMSASGVTPLLLIDGQQRMTTIVLIVAALADFSRSNPQRKLRFSHDEITNRGYLIDTYKSGEDRYKLTLSQGDRETLVSLLEHLVNPKAKIVEDSSRLIENYNFFKKRIAALEDPNMVWDGIQRLDVVSISLDAGRDNPQLIFESMNSTGKDLSSADLIRNFVIMGLPRHEQDALYRNHWRPIEERLGADSYDDVFDEFIRNYLTVLYAPEPLAKRDVYSIFKRHVSEHGYDKEHRIVDLLEELESFARYYSAITVGVEKDPYLRDIFSRLSRLNVSVVNPLLLSLYHDFESGAFTKSDFVSMAALTESYIMRRAICDVPTNSLRNFFSSVISKLNRIQEDGGDYREAFESFLFLESGTARRFPSNSEFMQALTTRDAYHFRKSFHLLEGLENLHHPKNPLPIEPGTYTIEHIMPQNALAHDEWRAAIGEDADERFEPLLNNLGNLTLTAYNSELSDGSFLDKKKRIVGGYDKEYLVISKDVHDSSAWTPDHISRRSQKLAGTAVMRWPFLNVDATTASAYEAKRDRNPQSKARAGFKVLFDAGVITPGVVLHPVSDSYSTLGTVTEDGRIRLSNGETFDSPSKAAIRTVTLAGGSSGSRNGWLFWRLDSGPLLSALRDRYLTDTSGSIESDASRFKALFWSDFYEYCSENDAFLEAFNDPSAREQTKDHWASFGIGSTKFHLDALVLRSDCCIGVDVWCKDIDQYEAFLSKRDELDEAARNQGATISWDKLDADKKTRTVSIKLKVDFDKSDWRDHFAWMASWLIRLKSFCLNNKIG